MRILTINSVTTGAREFNGTSPITLATHNAKREMHEIKMKYRQVSRDGENSQSLYFKSSLFNKLDDL